MKLFVTIRATALLLGAMRVWCQDEEELTRPSDIWDVEVWGGLPAFDDDTQGPYGPLGWNQKPVYDPGARQGLSAAARLPNPCDNPKFLPPTYDLSGWNMTKTYLNVSGEYPLHYRFNVTVQDTANDYSVRCSGDFPVPWSPNTDWRVSCVPDNDQYSGNIWLVLFPLQRQDHGVWVEPREIWIPGTPVGMDHLWFCPPSTSANESDSSLYPRVYRANGGLRDNESRGTPTRFTGSCPAREMASVPYVCSNITTSPAVNTTLTRQLTSEKTGPLVPHPLAAPAEDRPQLVPTQDCTAMSLSYPDWVVEDGATYVPSSSKASLDTTMFNVTVTSRATGITNYCVWNGARQWLTCRPLAGALQDASQTSFQIYFNVDSRELSINQNWTCGDTGRTYL